MFRDLIKRKKAVSISKGLEFIVIKTTLILEQLQVMFSKQWSVNLS